jgi:hypothetical protein
MTGKLYNTSITSIVGVLRMLGTGIYTGLNQLVCSCDLPLELGSAHSCQIARAMHKNVLLSMLFLVGN